MENITYSIENFMKSSKRNTYINTDGITIYIRKSNRFINNQIVDFLDIASVNIKDKNRGKFQLLLKTLIYKYGNIYVESIINPIMCHILEKYGFSYKSFDNKNGYFICDMYLLKL